MKILFLTPQLPYPAHQGTSMRNLNILRGLAGENDLTPLSFTEVTGDPLPEPLAGLCERVVVVGAPAARATGKRLWQLLTSGKPDMALRLLSVEYEVALRSMLLEELYDVIQIEGIEMAWTIPVIRELAPGTAVVYDAHNAETVLQRRSAEADRHTVRRWPAVFYSWLQSSRLAAYEAWVCNAVDYVTAVSETDSISLRGLPGVNVRHIPVIPNAVDVQAYQADNLTAGPDKAGTTFDILFSGKMDYRPNVDAVLWFANEVWPLIIARAPSATWAIVGQKPHARLAALNDLDGVTVTGWVPSVQPYLANSRVFIMPFRVGSGTRLKLIEALASGKAVVSTVVGVEGFDVVDGEHLLIAETAGAFADQVVRLLADPELCLDLGMNGREFAKSYDWRVVTPRFREVYDELLGEDSR